MTGLLAGRVAVVTGGARGIGLQVAERYVEEGAAVVLADVDLAAAEQQAARLVEGGARALAGYVDVTDEASLELLADLAERAFGPVGVLVANAGVLVQAPALETSAATWRRAVEVNLTGAFLSCTAFGRRMVIGGAGGRVVLSSSLFGVRGGRDNAAYAATKFALIGLAQSLAAEWAPAGVLVNSVCPGQVDTSMMRQLITERAALRGTSEQSVERELVSRVPLGRLADPREIADLYVFLASPLSRYVTGQALVGDGGWLVG